MENKRIEDKIDRIAEDIVEIKVTMAVNTESLVEHMRRSDALEAHQDEFKKAFVPIYNAYHMVLGAGKLLVYIGAIVGTLLGIAELVLKVIK